MSGLKLLLLVVGCLGCFPLAFSSAADKVEHGFLDRVFKDADGKEGKYVLFVPHDYQGDKPYPLIVSLHGLNSGSNKRNRAGLGLGPAIMQQEKTFSFIAIFPQSKKQTWEADSPDAKRAMQILARVQKTYKVDYKRIYLTGASMGGNGTWDLAAKYPKRWAAIVPICGVGEPSTARKIKDIPCWCFHGAADKDIPVEASRKMIKALRAAGGKPRYTEYPGVDHNSWDRAYANPKLYEWLMQQHLK